MGDGNQRIRPAAVVIIVMGTILTAGTGILITGSISAHNKAEGAANDVIAHDGAPVAHPVLQERMNGNYEKIQIQQEAIKDDIGDLDKKIDRVLEAVDK